VSKLGELLVDRPIPALQEAADKTEYVMRHKGAHFLKSPAKNLHWYQVMLVDVTLFLGLLIIIVLILIASILKLAFMLFKRICSSAVNKLKKI